MKTAPSSIHLPALLATLVGLFLTSGAQGDEFRTFTNTQGADLVAKVIKVQQPEVTIILENGQDYTIPINSLSEEDQAYIAQWKPMEERVGELTEDKGVAGDRFNKALGQSLFDGISLWQSDPTTVAERLEWPRESQTSFSESFRLYPSSDYRFLGARPYSAALYGEDGKVTSASLVFANKGDSFGAAGAGEDHFIGGKPVPGGIEGFRMLMEHDAETIEAALTELLGEGDSQRFGDGESRTRVLRWDWNGHAFLLSHVEDEYVGLSVQTTEFADERGRISRVPESIIRERLKAGIEHRGNGDVILANLPMVDQGPKGYCAPATVERCMRYLGIPADMYLLAMVGETQMGGGTSTGLLLNNIGQDIKRKGRKFDAWYEDLSMRDVQKHIDDGIPLMWAIYSTSDFNDIASARTAERQEIFASEGDFSAYTEKVTKEAETSVLVPDPTRSHLVIIIGYNEETNEIAFSDSWGERYRERWISLPEAEQISQDRFYVIDL